MAKRKLTEQDFKLNPDLFYKKGLVIGDEIDEPDEENKEDKSAKSVKKGKGNVETQDDNEDNGGGNHPVNPPGKP